MYSIRLSVCAYGRARAPWIYPSTAILKHRAAAARLKPSSFGCTSPLLEWMRDVAATHRARTFPLSARSSDKILIAFVFIRLSNETIDDL